MGDIPTLAQLGWDVRSGDHIDPGTRPARVVMQSSSAWHVLDGTQALIARAPSRPLRMTPVTGDWVTIKGDGASCVVAEVLPRSTTLSRGAAGRASGEQVIAANVDVVASCVVADAVNPRRLERELTAIWASGATPVVIITKADLVADAADVLEAVMLQCPGVEVQCVSAMQGVGLDALVSMIGSGKTLALIGPSGAGKSTLVNRLLGGEVMPTAEVRADGRGRHTTTSRHLLPLPGGGLLLDTPGMREFAPWADEDALAETFADLDALARGCRFTDCAHDQEPGCAVRSAIENDPALAARLEHWRKLQREVEWMERRHDAHLQKQEGKRWAAMTKDARARIRHR